MSINNAKQYAQEGYLVTFGIVPSSAETGYGYIKSFEELRVNKVSSKIEKFVEKPDIESAKKFIKDNHYTWNSGMFLFKTELILNELKKYNPLILNKCAQSMKNSVKDLDFIRIDKASFSQCPDISIDVAVLEKTQKAYVLPLDCGWNDIGNWESLWKHHGVCYCCRLSS